MNSASRIGIALILVTLFSSPAFASAPHRTTAFDNRHHDKDRSRREILSRLPDGDSHRETGEWNWAVMPQSGTCDQDIRGSFSVNPEPVSSLLFLFGGGGMIAATKLRKKFKK